MELLDRIPAELDADHIAKRLRIEPGSSDAESLYGIIERVRKRMNPKAVYEVCYVGPRGADTIRIGPVTFTSRVLSVNLAAAHRVFPYIATCGAELDEPPPITDDPLESYWLDEIKKLVLGAAIAFLKDHISKKYRPGRLSSMQPGSLENWPITQQPLLFEIFGGQNNPAGVRLTDSFLMLPTKSVSGIFFPAEVDFASCRLCPRPDCPGRRAEYDPHEWEKYAPEDSKIKQQGKT